MKINEIEISGFKGIPHLVIHPKQINILVGKNNTGKTSVLEAIFSTLRVSMSGMQIKYGQHLSSLINVNKKESKVVVKLENENKYLLLRRPELKEIIPEFKKQLIDRIKSISHGANNKNGWEKAEEIVDKILSKNDLLSEIEKTAITIESGNEKLYIFSYTPLILKEIEPLLDYISKINPHGTPKRLIPIILSNPRFSHFEGNKKSEKVSTFIEDLAVGERLDINKSTVDKIQNYLKDKKILKCLERFDFDKLFFRDDKKEYEIPYSFMGDGFKCLIGLIAQTSIENKIVLIEEPENHMHPAYIKEFIRQMIVFSETNDMQFFITTHSSDILDVVSTDMLEPKYQEYLSKELDIISLDTLGDDILVRELTKKDASEELENLKIDLRGNE